MPSSTSYLPSTACAGALLSKLISDKEIIVPFFSSEIILVSSEFTAATFSSVEEVFVYPVEIEVITKNKSDAVGNSGLIGSSFPSLGVSLPDSDPVVDSLSLVSSDVDSELDPSLALSDSVVDSLSLVLSELDSESLLLELSESELDSLSGASSLISSIPLNDLIKIFTILEFPAEDTSTII